MDSPHDNAGSPRGPHQHEEEQGDRLLETFLNGAGTYEDFIRHQGAAAWAYQVDDILTDKCSEWRLLSNVPRLREKYRDLSKHLYHRPPNHCRKLEASDLQTSKHPKDDPRCDFDSSFIRFLRDLHIAKYVNMGALTVDNSRHSAVDLRGHYLLGHKGDLVWAWKAAMKQGNCTQVFFIMTHWPHDMLQAVCDKFAQVVNDFISQKALLKEPPKVWNNLRTALYLAFTSPTIRSWDTLVSSVGVLSSAVLQARRPPPPQLSSRNSSSRPSRRGGYNRCGGRGGGRGGGGRRGGNRGILW
ncbi:unnamed protein product [Vitrella brassicaformis CCMP3155]|uniref:Uncharacterized protein n=1 Tax=Vitrella brassicaformis (strain CCMP3155) TaxID=1169540 RepID=A0A0G4H0Z2_VITBC|nr:unnamed protein product [Vitrella brassicaformis CCMP3155]|eukprot:CEM37213.1 unnamed protein product [Vitrella brassicaformis CCMP3155]